MCQIQLVKPLNYKNLTKKDVENFSNLMYWGSFRNSDSYGWYSNTQFHKSIEKLDFDKVYNELSKSKHEFLIGHNRYKTKGDNKVMDNNHPFETEHFVVVHNGVLSNDESLKRFYDLEYKVETDSYIIPALLEHFYSSHNDVIKAIKQTAEEIYGSFSIVVFFKPEQRIFYFKEKGTDFAFGLAKDGDKYTLYGSTDRDNLESLNCEYLFNFFKMSNNMIITEPDEEVIYELLDTELKVVERFKEKTFNYDKDYGYSKSSSSCSMTKTYTEPSTIKGKFKKIASFIEKRVFEDIGIIPINRSYEYKNRCIVFDFRKDDYPQENMRTYLEDSLISYGDCEWVMINDKFKFKFTPDFSQFQDEKDWKDLEKAQMSFESRMECRDTGVIVGLKQLLGD